MDMKKILPVIFLCCSIFPARAQQHNASKEYVAPADRQVRQKLAGWRLGPEAHNRLEEIGAWMKINGEGIYAYQAVAPYPAKNIFNTKSKDKPVLYAFWLSDKAEVSLPATLEKP